LLHFLNSQSLSEIFSNQKASILLIKMEILHLPDHPLSSVLTLNFFAYLVGFIGVLVEWRSYWLQSRHGFRCWSAAGAFFWSLQYYLLNAWTSALTMFVTAIRTFMSGYLDKAENKHGFALGFVVLFAVLTLISWQGFISLIPAFAVVNTTLALFYLENRKMRVSLLLSSFAWIVNDIYWQAWPALFAESIAVCINIRTIYKLFSLKLS
jgi:hypothetical protein